MICDLCGDNVIVLDAMPAFIRRLFLYYSICIIIQCQCQTSVCKCESSNSTRSFGKNFLYWRMSMQLIELKSLKKNYYHLNLIKLWFIIEYSFKYILYLNGYGERLMKPMMRYTYRKARGILYINAYHWKLVLLDWTQAIARPVSARWLFNCWLSVSLAMPAYTLQSALTTFPLFIIKTTKGSKCLVSN